MFDNLLISTFSLIKIETLSKRELLSRICSFQMKNEIQKAKHKLDGDLRCSQEAALELERSKSEVQQAIQRKDKEFAAMQAKIEDEQGLGSKLQKQVKELGVSFFDRSRIPHAFRLALNRPVSYSFRNVSRKTFIAIKAI